MKQFDVLLLVADDGHPEGKRWMPSMWNPIKAKDLPEVLAHFSKTLGGPAGPIEMVIGFQVVPATGASLAAKKKRLKERRMPR